MGKNTNILIGAGALAVVYYLYNASKASASVSPNGETLPPIVTNQLAPPVVPVTPMGTKPVVTTPASQLDIVTSPANYTTPKPTEVEIAASLNKLSAMRAAQEEADRLAKVKAQQDENVAAAKVITDAAAKAKADAEAKSAADEAARQKAMNAFMYPTCPDGFEFYQNNCMPTYIIVEEKAKKGEGLVLRDYINNTTTLVQTCPAEYVKQGINCMPRYSLSPQQLQVLAMEEAGMVQTSDGQWYTNAAAAAAAQAIIDARGGVSYDAYGRPVQNQNRTYSARQSSINDAICSITTAGVINNPYSAYTNGMSLSQYIGEFKVTSDELRIARASCPNSVYSSGRIAGGGTDDAALGYK